MLRFLQSAGICSRRMGKQTGVEKCEEGAAAGPAWRAAASSELLRSGREVEKQQADHRPTCVTFRCMEITLKCVMLRLMSKL